ncbi:hypothetical protein NOS3756_16480 [Nostoc sp. NIES-3756]|uniref:hypothetical protein n=1 Tax=Nostoc sp. NIES-3756 TaxID=1751286 RepID=UPI0007214B58|nr:hypothetical protein [Nostoc sp. NIES-3756]BAT52707.1 hypothetical protein NOS3756_16480 [Nostoc sp. NIES-3756]
MSNIPEKPFGQYDILLKNGSGHLFSASVELACRDWNDERGRRTECIITLRLDNTEIQCIDWHFFGSFKQIRQQLALQDIYPICYGASRKIIVTGMALEMGLGLKVYKAALGSYSTSSDLVHIFATGEDVEPVTVEVQEEFHRQWLESIRKE